MNKMFRFHTQLTLRFTASITTMTTITRILLLRRMMRRFMIWSIWWVETRNDINIHISLMTWAKSSASRWIRRMTNINFNTNNVIKLQILMPYFSIKKNKTNICYIIWGLIDMYYTKNTIKDSNWPLTPLNMI